MIRSRGRSGEEAGDLRGYGQRALRLGGCSHAWVEVHLRSRHRLDFVKFAGAPLGPKWVPPAGSLLALRLVSCASVSESDARDIEAMESKALLTVQVESERELSSTHIHTFSLSSPSFCRYKTAPPRIPSVSPFPNQVKLNLSTSALVQSSNNKLVQSSNSKSVHSYASVERNRDEDRERCERREK